jgi:hypothetical protein
LGEMTQEIFSRKRKSATEYTLSEEDIHRSKML